MEKRDSIDDALTLVSITDSEQTLLPECDAPDLARPCHFFNLPIDIRKTIYRYLCLSDKDRTSHPRLWRPSGNGGVAWANIGYFDRGTVIPLLSLCRQIHNEAAAVLYGENLFAFHVSELSQGPVLFFSWLAGRYVQLLRRLHIRTGFNVNTYGQEHCECRESQAQYRLRAELTDYQVARNLALSAAMVKQAWPKEYRVRVNLADTIVHSQQDDLGVRRRSEAIDWPLGSYHLWKMVPVDESALKFKPEFRRAKLTDEEHKV